jgi:hypothetical protein
MLSGADHRLSLRAWGPTRMGSLRGNSPRGAPHGLTRLARAGSEFDQRLPWVLPFLPV